MSTFGNIIALTGAGMSGYLRGQRAATEQKVAEEEQDDKRKKRERENERAAKADRVERDLGSAWMTRDVAPNMVKPETADNRDVGQPDVALAQDGYRVGATTPTGNQMAEGPVVPDMAQAQAMATAANQPQARDRRVADVYGAAGQYDKAMAVSEGAQKRELSAMQTDEAKRKLAQEQIVRGFYEASKLGPQGVAQFMTDHYHDGHAYEVLPGQGEAFTIVKRDAAGNEVTRGEFKGIPDLIQREGGSIDPMKWAAEVEKRAADARKEVREDRQLAVQERNAASNEAYRATMGGAAVTRAAGAGAGKRADHFDEKQWDAAYKIEPTFVTFTNDIGDKSESPELRQVFRAELNKYRTTGDSSPTEAAELARDTVLKLRDAAERRVAAAQAADPRSTMTANQAVKEILAEFQAAQRAAAQAAQQPPAGAAPAGPVAAAPAAAAAPRSLQDVAAQVRRAPVVAPVPR